MDLPIDLGIVRYSNNRRHVASVLATTTTQQPKQNLKTYHSSQPTRAGNQNKLSPHNFGLTITAMTLRSASLLACCESIPADFQYLNRTILLHVVEYQSRLTSKYNLLGD